MVRSLLLDALDKSSFTTSSAHNPLTTLYCRIAEVQRSSKTPLSDDMLIMLLCKWATTPHRYGDHRPLVTTRILAQRQNDIIKVIINSVFISLEDIPGDELNALVDIIMMYN